MSQSPLQNRLRRAVVVIAACLLVAAWIPRQLTLNPTNSLPNTLYVLNKSVLPEKIRRGDIVRFPFKSAVTDAVANGQPVYLLKKVGCIQGQVLTVNKDKEYFCDGRWLGRAKDHNMKGEPVQNFVWNGMVPPGEFFALADHKDSYDSRYYGFVELGRVVAKAYPIF